MKFYCFGSRGSLPAPSCKLANFYTDEYGGNTTCYYLEAGDFYIIFDAGSGAKGLGDYLMKQGKIGKNFLMLLSHYHSDHIQGIGFHIPFYIPSNRFLIHGFIPTDREYNFVSDHVENCLVEQQSSPFFPVPHASLPAKREYIGLTLLNPTKLLYRIENGVVSALSAAEYKADNKDHISITTIPLNHPNGCLGYRIDYMGKSVTFCTDNEPLLHTNKNINKIAANTDLLVLDGQYTMVQLSTATQGFGHGNPENCVEQAKAAKAKKLLIHHHDPGHDDKTLAKMEEECRKYAAGYNMEFAKDGMIWDI
jgi:phosphoribosyl 1,2-cyclic phosphodiesterase